MLDNRITPAETLVSITPHDTNYLAKPIRALYVGASGDVKITDLAGTAITLVGLAAGVFHPVCAIRVYSTGTTATGIVGVY
jgi:hypothetical protein